MHEIDQIVVEKNLIEDISEIDLRKRETWLNGTAFGFYANKLHIDPEDTTSLDNLRNIYDIFISKIGEYTVELFIPIIFEKELSQYLDTQQ